jgi:hypothetical protein
VDLRAIVRLEGLGQLKKSNDLNGNRTRDLRACSIVPHERKLPSRNLRHYSHTYLEGGEENLIQVRLCPGFELKRNLANENCAGG